MQRLLSVPRLIFNFSVFNYKEEKDEEICAT